jgi:hypothetical protein
MYTTFCISIHLFMHLGWFHLLTSMASAAMNMGVQVSVWDFVFKSSENTPICRISRSYSSSMFDFLMKLHSTFYHILMFASFFITTDSAQGSQFLHIFTNQLLLFLRLCIFFHFFLMKQYIYITAEDVMWLKLVFC